MNMKKILLLVLPLMVMCFASSCIKEEEWTDDSPIIQFKDPKFLEALLDNNYITVDSKQFPVDRNGDGQISEKEAATATSLSLISDGIRNIDEIKYFTAITSLYCSENQLTSLDLSNNTALTALYCDDNQLTSLDVSKNTALEYLNCGDVYSDGQYANELCTLDLSNNTALTELYCTNNKLTTLIISGCAALTSLDCRDNQLTTLDVSGCSALDDLDCSSNPQLLSIDLSKNAELTSFSCYGTGISNVDLSKNRKLKRFYPVYWYEAQGEIKILNKDEKCPLERTTFYKYHVLDSDVFKVLDEVYPRLEILYAE